MMSRKKDKYKIQLCDLVLPKTSIPQWETLNYCFTPSLDSNANMIHNV